MRPSIDEVRFISITRKRFTWEESHPSGKLLDSCRYCDVNEDELSYDWKTAIDAFTPWVRELMVLGAAWEMAQVDSIAVSWQWSGDDWLMKINKIVVSRESLDGEVPMKRIISTGTITEEGFEIGYTEDLLNNLWDECWKHYTSRPEQLTLLAEPSPTGTRSKAPDLRLVS